MTQIHDEQQLQLDEIVVEDADIQEALSDYVDSKREASQANKVVGGYKKKVEAIIEQEGWKENQRIRVGPFVITITPTSAAAIAFDRKAGRKVHVVRAE